MTSIEKVDYDDLYEEVLSHYMGKNFPVDVKRVENYKTTKMEASTLDEYISFLIEGYINIELCSDLDNHLMDLLENKWFHQWPQVYWSYASRLLHGKGIRRSTKRATKVLLPMAKEGHPGAMHDIGCYYRLTNSRKEFNYELAICLWLESSKKGYLEASKSLNDDYDNTIAYRWLPEELKLFFLNELYMLYFRNNNNDPAEVVKNLNEQELKRFKGICNEGKKLQKVISERAFMRNTTRLAWNDEENPYKIDF